MADPYFSEIRYQSNNGDFLEVAVARDYDVSDLVVTLYDDQGLVIGTYSLVGLTPTLIGGKDVYVIDSATLPDLQSGDGVSISENGTVYSFLSFNAGTPALFAQNGPAAGMTATDIPQTTGNESAVSFDGTTYTPATPNPGFIPCLTLGTYIQTADGHVKVENLQRGMPVMATSGECKNVLAVFSRRVTQSELTQSPNLYPVRITAGALGKGLPKVDLLVSRQHRMLVSSPIVKRMFGVPEALIAAIKLAELPGVFVDTSVTEVTYFHLVFENHEVIFAEGAPTESLLLGDEAVKALPQPVLDEIEAIFGELLLPQNTALPGRFIPKGHQQKTLVARHATNQKALLSDFDITSGA